jgi:hypothetical protein
VGRPRLRRCLMHHEPAGMPRGLVSLVPPGRSEPDYMFATIAFPNSLVLRSVAPAICRSKS